MAKTTVRTAFLDTVPVMAGYVFLGFGFGILMHQNGFGVLWAAAMSLFIYAGSMQYVAVSLLASGVGLLTAALTDETYSLVSQIQESDDASRHSYCFLVSLFDHCYWVGGTILGSLAGSLIPINYEGIDFVLTALFVTIFVEQWLSTKDHRPAVIGAASTALCLLLFGADVFLIPSMGLIAGLLILLRAPKKEVPHA